MRATTTEMGWRDPEPDKPYHVQRWGEEIGSSSMYLNVVYFPAGVRTHIHSHTVEQVLYYAEGVGVVWVEGGEEQLIQPGQAVRLPPNIPHSHGAAHNGSAWHLSIMPKQGGEQQR